MARPDRTAPEPIALLLTGTVGAGKSTTAEAVADRWRRADVPNAVIDLDEIRRYWPQSPTDPFGFEVLLANLAAVATTYRRVGARRLVLAGVCETRPERERITAALGLPLTVVRLRATPEQLDHRLRHRHADDPLVRDWHLHRAGELDAVLDAADVADLDVVVGDRTPAALAAEVLARVEGTSGFAPPVGDHTLRQPGDVDRA